MTGFGMFYEPIVMAEASREQLERMPEFKYEP